MDAIFKRVSIRNYTNEIIDKQIIKKLLRAGMSAPSAGNERPWYFIVVDDKTILQELSETSPYSKMISKAQIAIVVCADPSKSIFEDDYWIIDCAAATENILIEITANNLGSVWLAVYPDEKRIENVRKVLDINNNIFPYSILPIGYPVNIREAKDRYDAERVFFNKWKGGNAL